MATRFAGRILPVATILGLALAACATATNTDTPTTADLPSSQVPADQIGGKAPAPEFPEGLDWINVSEPLTLDDLRGKVVLLDFWTYGCINCIHMIPVLERLEEKHPDELVIIGVHSAKFANEGETENIAQIVRRYDLHHPVINDNEFEVWQLYRARAWPTIAIVDPRGNLYAMDAGEIPFDALDSVIGELIDQFDAIGEINREPIDLLLEGASSPGSPLLFPGKVLADEAGNRLFIADSNHHRIVIADLSTYEVLDVIGTGQRGLADGGFEETQFNKPQGMALDGETLYVADTNNHAIRAVDLAEKTVATIAGTGIQGTSAPLGGFELPGPPTTINLRSPWDVELGDEGTLYIAMAGTHQIWALSLEDDTLRVVVGSGREALMNRSLIESDLAQPSGLHYNDGLLYFADSESSAIRVADFNKDMVNTLAGPLENTLDVVEAPDGLIYFADTYNSKIKVIDPETNETTTAFGLGGVGGYRDGGTDEAQFDEPGGLDYADGRLYVADTNNHAIRVIDLKTEIVSTISFPNREALRIRDEVTIVGGEGAPADLALPEQTLASGEGAIVIRLALPEGFKINDLIDSFVTFSIEGDAITIGDADMSAAIDAEEVRIPATLAEGSGILSADLTIYYCRVGEEELCFVDTVVVEVPITVGEDYETTEVVIERAITPPPDL